MRPRRQTSGFPAVACHIQPCGRRTTRIEPCQPGGQWLETGSEDPEWICGTHWARVPRYLKRRRTWLVRYWRRICPTGAYWDYPGGSAERLRILRVEDMVRRTWRRCIAFARGEVELPDEALPAGLSEELTRLGL